MIRFELRRNHEHEPGNFHLYCDVPVDHHHDDDGHVYQQGNGPRHDQESLNFITIALEEISMTAIVMLICIYKVVEIMNMNTEAQNCITMAWGVITMMMTGWTPPPLSPGG